MGFNKMAPYKSLQTSYNIFLFKKQSFPKVWIVFIFFASGWNFNSQQQAGDCSDERRQQEGDRGRQQQEQQQLRCQLVNKQNWRKNDNENQKLLFQQSCCCCSVLFPRGRWNGDVQIHFSNKTLSRASSKTTTKHNVL